MAGRAGGEQDALHGKVGQDHGVERGDASLFSPQAEGLQESVNDYGRAIADYDCLRSSPLTLKGQTKGEMESPPTIVAGASCSRRLRAVNRMPRGTGNPWDRPQSRITNPASRLTSVIGVSDL